MPTPDVNCNVVITFICFLLPLLQITANPVVPNNPIYERTVLEVRGLKVGVPGLMSRCQRAVLLLAALEEHLSAHFFQLPQASHVPGLWLLSPSSTTLWSIFNSLSLCFSYHFFSDVEPTQIVQDNLISKSGYYHLNLISLILVSLCHNSILPGCTGQAVDTFNVVKILHIA